MLLAYVVTAFLARPDWRQVVLATIVPRLGWDSLYVTTMVAVLGTTISPYLFFWQASHEVEEEKARGRRTVAHRRGATAHELADARLDVATGMFFSNLVMFFIILATGATLHASGRSEIESARQAAEALRPLAGDGAYLLFAMGLIGTGLLAPPLLLLVMLVGNNRAIMGEHANGPWLNLLGWLATALMFLAALAFLVISP